MQRSILLPFSPGILSWDPESLICGVACNPMRLSGSDKAFYVALGLALQIYALLTELKRKTHPGYAKSRRVGGVLCRGRVLPCRASLRALWARMWATGAIGGKFSDIGQFAGFCPMLAWYIGSASLYGSTKHSDFSELCVWRVFMRLSRLYPVKVL